MNHDMNKGAPAGGTGHSKATEKFMDNNWDWISNIQSATGAGLIGWQFAADGKWDVAERVFFEKDGSLPFALARVGQWLARQTTDNIALEALFEGSNGERFFFGVRITLLAAQKKKEVADRLISKNQRVDDINQVIQNVRDAIDEQRLATASPDYLELGVFDLWNRVKSLVVWEKNETLGAKSELIVPEEMLGRTRKTR